LLGGENFSHLDAAAAHGSPHVPTPEAPSRAHPRVELLTAAIAVVRRESSVLLVCRRAATEGITWGFPAGVVKPGSDPAAVATSEALAETGAHCAVARALGSRLHPLTGVLCEYFLCDFLGGTISNRDVVENLTVSWVDRQNLGRYVPLAQIFPPVLDALEITVPDPTAADRPAVVAAVIVVHDRVLLVRRRISEGGLFWQFPGGEAEPGESPEQAAVRETREEVGLEVVASSVIGDRVHPATGRHMVYVACTVSSGEAHVADEDELDQVAWSSMDELPDYVPTGIFQPVQQHLETLLHA
jgi:8-oxo-dGTP diphosphatase